MSDVGTFGPCLTAEEARKITKEKRLASPPRPEDEPNEEDVAWAKTHVRSYFARNVESRLRWGCSDKALYLKIDGSSRNMHACALARELANFLRALGYHAAYGPHVTQWADELEDDEFWPVTVNW